MVLKVLDLFAGAGGFTLAGEMAGAYETVAFCEIDKHAQKVLRKNWPGVPVFDDVTKLKGSDVGTVDLITGGFPCQDLSTAGKGAGIGEGTRSGLFREMLRLAQETGYPYILFENVSRLLSGPTDDPGQWFGEFLWSLAEVGYDAEWFCLTASSFGAPHERERVCVVAYPNRVNGELRSGCGPGLWMEEKAKGANNNIGRSTSGLSPTSYPDKTFGKRRCISERVYEKHALINRDTSWWQDWGGGEPQICGVDDGVSKRSYLRRSGIMGNAIAPPVWSVVMEAIREEIEAHD